MESITIIVTALAAGAVAASKDVATQAIKDAYTGLKALIARKFSGNSDVAIALEQVEKKPDSEGRKATLAEELTAAEADQDAELVKQAQALLNLLKKHEPNLAATYTATLTGSGAIAQGGSVAGGKGSTVIGGSAHGSVYSGGQKPDDK